MEADFQKWWWTGFRAFGVMIWYCFTGTSFGQASLFDSSFSVSGGANGPVNSLVVQGDGKILVGGEFTRIGGQDHAYLARFESNGDFDASFPMGTDGPVYKLVAQSDGRILVGGDFTNLQGTVGQKVGRLLANGLADPAFDAGTNIGLSETVFTLAVQPDEKILVGSFDLDLGYNVRAKVRRLTDNGDSDHSFISTNIFDFLVRTFLVQTNGSILVGGGFQHVNNFSIHSLAQISTNGQLDTSVGPVFQGYSDVFSLLRTTNGNILVAGVLYPAANTKRLLLMQLSPTLELDTGFVPDNFDESFTVIRSVLQQPDAKLLVGGTFYQVGGYWRRHIGRLDALGHTDPCFDPGLGLGGMEGIRALALQPDGKVVAGGVFSDEFTYTNVVRFLGASDCDATRVYLRRTDSDNYFVAATCAPGGTNLFQVSSNLVDWVTTYSTTTPYIYFGYQFSSESLAVFRVKKQF